MLLHYLGKLKSQTFCIFVHVKHVSNVTFYHLSNRYLLNVTKICAKIQHYAKYQHFTFCSFSVDSKIKALQLSKADLSTIKHQHSKKLTPWADATWTKNTRKSKLFANSLFKKGVQNVHHLHGHMPGDAFSTDQLQCR